MISSSPHTSPRNTHGRKNAVRRALATSLTALVLLVACSRQEEGDRCSTRNDDNDCESGLVCKAAETLRTGKSDGVARCCPPEGNSISNDLCTPLIGGGGSDGGGNLGGQAGETNTNAGDKCSYNSNCVEGLVCGPQGKCQSECLEDRDCPSPEVCDAGRCVR